MAGEDDHRASRDQMAAALHCHLPPRRVLPAQIRCSFAYSTHVKELRPQLRIAVVCTPPEGCAGQGRDLADASHLRAEVMGLEIDGDPVWLEHRVQGIGDLLANTLLNCKALGEQAHKASEFGNTNDVLVRDIAHVSLPVKRQRVVFAETKKVNRPLDHLAQAAVWSTATLGLEDREQ